MSLYWLCRGRRAESRHQSLIGSPACSSLIRTSSAARPPNVRELGCPSSSILGFPGLVLCRSSHVFLHCQVGEKLADFLLTDFQGMPLVVIEDRALGRIDAGFPGNLNFPKERSCDTISIGSAKSSGRGHYTEALWSMQTMGASTDTFFIVTCSGYLCRGVL